MRITSVHGSTAILHCLTGFGGGLDDHFSTRSFALAVLLDAAARVDDVEHQAQGAPKEDAERMLALAAKVRKLGNASPLLRALPDPRLSDADWHREHVPRFIRRTKLLSRHNDLGVEKLRAIADELVALPRVWPFMRAAWSRLHSFELEVEATHPKYLEHLVAGVEFGTTAYDIWLESDPKKDETLAPSDELEAKVEAALRRRLDGLVDSLLAKGLIELKSGKRAALLKQLARVDADEELTLYRKIVHVLSTSKAVEELYGSDEELIAETRDALSRP